MPQLKKINAVKIETIMGLIINIGVIISMGLVTLGGIKFLLEHGHENIHFDFQPSNSYIINLKLAWQAALSFSSLGIIELGLIVLVATQIIRVGLLVGFYSITRDYWFSIISLFIFIILVYSFFFVS
jgi:uncharacterized membrane protein